jgi:hypothetical protein
MELFKKKNERHPERSRRVNVYQSEGFLVQLIWDGTQPDIFALFG